MALIKYKSYSSLSQKKVESLGFGAHFFSICLSCQVACYAREVGDYL